MFKSLRKKFIATAVGSVAVVVAVLAITLNFINFNKLEERIDTTLLEASKSQALIKIFTEDGDETQVAQPQAQPQAVKTPTQRPAYQEPVREVKQPQPRMVASSTSQSSTTPLHNENITRLHARQQELAQNHTVVTSDKVTIDVRYPKKYEDAPTIVDLLLANESVLIDFQYMTEVQARRCIDYLDGAKQVLMGNLRKVSGTMYLLTPVNVVVNIEDIKLPEGVHSDFDFDMKRR